MQKMKGDGAMKKRILSLFLALALLCCLLPMQSGVAQAYFDTDVVYPVTGGNLYFDKETGTITDCDAEVTAADIPAEIEGVAVVSIGDYAFSDCGSLTSITIPNSMTRIGENAFEKCHALLAVIIPDSVTDIDDYAFSCCISLTNVTIPSGVTSIGDYAFSNCNSLTDLTISNSVENIGDYAFSGCNSLTKVTIPDSVTSIGNYAFEFCSKLTEAMISNSVTSIGEGTFFNCFNLTGVTIPDSVTSIGSFAFGYCDKLNDVTIPNSVKSISDYAFEYCTNLTNVTIPDSVTSIGSKAFCYCKSLTEINVAEGNEVYASENGILFDKDKTSLLIYPLGKTEAEYTIPNSVTDIGAHAFEYCDQLTGVTIPDSVTRIGDYAFSYCSGLTDLTIPDHVTSIGESAFKLCSSLTSATIPEGMMSIGNSLFSGCSSLASVTIPDSVTNIGDYAFSGCSGLTSLTIPDSVTSIGNSALLGTGYYNDANNWQDGAIYLSHWLLATNEKELPTVYTIKEGTVGICDNAFSYCRNLTDVTIPNSVKHIEERAFYCCSGLSDVTIPNSVTSIGKSAFYECGLISVTIPDSVTSIDDYAFQSCSFLKEINVTEGNTAYISKDGVLFNADMSVLVSYPGGKTEDAYAIPDGVTSISDGALSCCRPLFYVTIPNSVTSIGNDAFYFCYNLSDVTIPNSVTSIGERAFSDCYTLTSVTIPNSVTSIGKKAFYNCNRLIQVTIPNRLTSIDELVFYNCVSLSSVTIPESVTSIGNDAFYNCYGLTSVYFMGDTPALVGAVFEVIDSETLLDINIPGLTFYYIEGKEGWRSPIWHGYPTAIWNGMDIPHDHSYQATVTAPTCTEQGYMTHTCTVCGDSYVDTYADALGHKTELRNGKEATCTEVGYTGDEYCTVCKQTVKTGTTIPALGHDYKDGICTVCGEKNPNYKPVAPIEFTDVQSNEWYADAVEYAVQNGLMNGVGNGRFDPEGSMTRAMLVTVLWRFEGEPEAAAHTFSDVPNGQWYTDAVAWAAANGVVNGVGENRFDPDGKITREQMATILYRYCTGKGIEVDKQGELGSFPDAGKVSSYAKEPMQWCVAEGVINGSDGELLPQGDATRAQVATILMRFIENIVKK